MVGFLVAILVLARLCDDDGLFRACGAWMARRSAGRPRRLLALVFVVASVTTAVLSLDTTVVLLTPVVLATATRLGVRARPHVYACAHLANSASVLLPVSNLTNLLAFAVSGLTFGRFAALMALPWLAVIGVEYVVSAGSSPRIDPRPAGGSRDSASAAAGVHRDRGRGDLWPGSRSRRPRASARRGPRWPARRCWRAGRWPGGRPHRWSWCGPPTCRSPCSCSGWASWSRQWCATASAPRWIRWCRPGRHCPRCWPSRRWPRSWPTCCNNLPAVLVLLPLAVTPARAAVLAVLLGVSLGPNLTYTGSLATLLWRRTCVRDGTRRSLTDFTRLGLLAVRPGCWSRCWPCGPACGPWAADRR